MANLKEKLLRKLSETSLKLLLKSLLGEPAGTLTGAATEPLFEKFGEYQNQRAARRHFEELGDRIATRLLPVFEAEELQRGPGLFPLTDIDAVIDQLRITLEGNVSAEFFVRNSLNAERLIGQMNLAREQLAQAEPPVPLPQQALNDLNARFYGKALDEAVRYVIAVARELPQFQEKTAARTLELLEIVIARVDHYLEQASRFEEIARERAEKENDRTKRFELDYRSKVLHELDRVELFGSDVPKEAQRNELTVAFVTLSIHREKTDIGPAGLMSCQAVFNELNFEPGRLMIFGGAGCGKTTLLRWAAIQAAGVLRKTTPETVHSEDARGFLAGATGDGTEQARILRADDPSTDDDHPEELVENTRRPRTGLTWQYAIPFFIRLRHCENGRLPPIEQLPGLIDPEGNDFTDPPAGWVEDVLREGRGLVLIDGVDEVPEKYRDALYRDIQFWATERFSQSAFVVTSRPEAISRDWLKPLDFLNSDLAPLSKPDRDRLVEKWHRTVQKAVARSRNEIDDLDAFRGRLLDRFANDPQLARLATNPLLCAMICALHWRGEKFATGQRAITEALCHMLLQRDELTEMTAEFPQAWRELTYDQRRAIVQELAVYMLVEEESSVPLEKALSQVGEKLKYLPDRSEEEAETVLETLIQRSGLLQRPKRESIDFVHNTFKELLAGDRFASAGWESELGKRVASREDWRNAGLFAAADPDGARRFAIPLLRNVLQQIDELKGSRSQEKKERLRTLRIFAVRCRAAALFLDDDVQTRADALLKQLFPPETTDEAAALAELGNLAVPHLARNAARQTESQAVASVRTLRLIETTDSRKAMQKFFGREEESVLVELAPVVDDPMQIAGMKSWLSTPDHRRNEKIKPHVHDLASLPDQPWAASLRQLSLSGTGVSDVSDLSGLPSLEVLDLRGTGVSDVSDLSGLPSLEYLHLRGTGVSDEQLAEFHRLRKAAGLRDCSIVR